MQRWPSLFRKPTAGEVQSLELGDDEQLATVLLEGQVAEPLEDLRHLLSVSGGKTTTRSCVNEPRETPTQPFGLFVMPYLKKPDPSRIPAMLSRATPVFTMFGFWTTPNNATVNNSPEEHTQIS